MIKNQRQFDLIIQKIELIFGFDCNWSSNAALERLMIVNHRSTAIQFDVNQCVTDIKKLNYSNNIKIIWHLYCAFLFVEVQMLIMNAITFENDGIFIREKDEHAL